MKIRSVFPCVLTLPTVVFVAVSGLRGHADERSDFFETRIRPVLVQRCEECHTGSTPEGDFRVDRLADLIAGGMSGPSLIARKPNQGTLIARLLADDEEKRMPPDGPLPESVIADFRKWIADGAYWPEGNVDWSPSAKTSQMDGRDHYKDAFTCWLAGGGVKGGFTYGATDEYGIGISENPVHIHDFHATIMHLLGFDHTKLTYFYGGRDFRLTGLAGKVIHEVVA